MTVMLFLLLLGVCRGLGRLPQSPMDSIFVCLLITWTIDGFRWTKRHAEQTDEESMQTALAKLGTVDIAYRKMIAILESKRASLKDNTRIACILGTLMFVAYHAVAFVFLTRAGEFLALIAQALFS